MVKNRSSGIKLKKRKPRVKIAARSVNSSRTPLAINTKTRNVAPRISSRNTGTVVSHREILRDSTSASPTFSIDAIIAVQPALSAYSHGSPMGPWLSKVAQEYDNYEFEALKVHYITSASSLQKGTIVMAFDPNPEGSSPGSLNDLRNMKHAVTGPARENLELDLSSVVRSRGKLLTRTKTVNSYVPYDAGRIFLGSTLGDGATVGYYEVEYSVRLSNPQTTPNTDAVVFQTPVPPASVVSARDGDPYQTLNFYFGRTDPLRNATAFTGLMTGQNATVVTSGDPNLLANRGYTNTTSNYYTVLQGIDLRIASGKPIYWFRPPLPGRYRLTARVPGDFQDYAMFGATLARFEPTTTSLVAAQDATVTLSGDIQYLPVMPSYIRGFSNPAFDCDDISLDLDLTFYVGTGSQMYSIVVGTRQKNSGGNVGQNDTGYWAIDNPNTMGDVVFKLEYLGALPTA